MIPGRTESGPESAGGSGGDSEQLESERRDRKKRGRRNGSVARWVRIVSTAMTGTSRRGGVDMYGSLGSRRLRANNLTDRRRTKRGRPLVFAVMVVAVMVAGCATSQGTGVGRLAEAGSAAAATGLTPTLRAESELSDADRSWIEETLAAMTVEERAAQLVMVWISGGYGSDTNAELAQVEELVREEGIGGVVISVGTPWGYAMRLNRLQRAAETPLLVTADFEAGPGFRVSGIYALPHMIGMGGATHLPPQMAFGAADNDSLVYEAGRLTAIEARALGVHLTFSPVVDVNNNAANPIINTRSFGEDPERVATLGAEWIRGARDGGLMTTAKHFPGHGDTGTDSHVALPVIPGDRARLDSIELVPFQRAIDEGVDAVMTAHVAAPGILGAGAPPATMSPHFMTTVLREDLGFDGVLFTDALDMGAIVDGYGHDEAALLAFEAGSDVLLMPGDPRGAIEAVTAAVRSGRVSPGRLEASVRRLLTLKARAGLHVAARVGPEALPSRVATAEHLAFAATAARRSITLPRDFARVLPLAERPASGEPGEPNVESAPSAILSVTYARSNDLAAGRSFDAALRQYRRVHSVRVGPDTHNSVYDSLARQADRSSYDVVLVSAYAQPGAARGGLDLPESIASFFAQVEAGGNQAVLISFGSPYLLTSVPDVGTYMVAWGGADALQRAAADALLGHAPITGRLPISLPPWHERGAGLDRPIGARQPDAAANQDLRSGDPVEKVQDSGMDPWGLARVDRIIESAIAEGVTPGAALAVGRCEGLVRLRGYGNLDWDSDATETAPVTPETLYDMASLTKVVGTTTAVMGLVANGDVALDDPAVRYLPEWAGSWKERITIKQLLTHQSGFPPFRPFWRDHEGPEEYRTAIAALDPDYEPGTRTVYSDIGFMSLAYIVEAVTGEAFDSYLERTLFEPLGMDATGFNPTDPSAAAPTEVDTVFRHRHVRGEVHDENAWAHGGVAGHAGLFSTAGDLAKFARWILSVSGAECGDDDEAAPAGLPPVQTVQEFTRRAAPESSRALGWDTPSGRSSSGRLFGWQSFGHTGFTGTSFWVDPQLDLFVVLLTNRVNPTRAERGHIPLRRAVHDAVAASVTDRTVEPRTASPPVEAIPGQDQRGSSN